MALPVFILAGGIGSRLGSLGEKTPKILIPIKGRPFLEFQLEWLIKNGISDLTYCVGHLGEQVVQHVESLKLPSELKISFSWDGEDLLGTGGAISQAVKKTEGKFLVTYGDSYLRADLNFVTSAFISSNSLALMTVFKNNNQFDVSNVELKGTQVVKYIKNHIDSNFAYIDYGIVGFDKKLFSKFATLRSFDLNAVIQSAIVQKQLFGLEIAERFFEIGSPKGILELEKYLGEYGRNE